MSIFAGKYCQRFYKVESKTVPFGLDLKTAIIVCPYEMWLQNVPIYPATASGRVSLGKEAIQSPVSRKGPLIFK